MKVPIFRGVKRYSDKVVTGDMFRQRALDDDHKIVTGFYIKTNTNKLSDNVHQVVRVESDSLEISVDGGVTFEKVEE